jgi:hypothetical protein
VTLRDFSALLVGMPFHMGCFISQSSTKSPTSTAVVWPCRRRRWHWAGRRTAGHPTAGRAGQPSLKI